MVPLLFSLVLPLFHLGQSANGVLGGRILPVEIDRALAEIVGVEKNRLPLGTMEGKIRELSYNIMVDRSRSSPRVVDRPTPLQVPKREIARLTPTLDSGQIVAELRAKIWSEQLGCDSIQQIVEAAWTVTGAHGAAIAMRQDNSVLCTARAGNMAPDLGSELSPDSGISGECLRTGGALRCDDTATDTRVDAEACRRLGLRSLAAAPVGKRPAVSGILEAFSSDPHAFNDSMCSF